MERSAAERLDRSDALASWRDKFGVDDSGPIYLDGNSLGRPARAVRDAVQRGLDQWETELVGGWSEWIDLPTRVGDQLGGLIGAASGQVIVCDSTTVNLYKVAAAALSLRPSRSVIIGDVHDFPTDRYVLSGLAAARGAELRLLQSDPVAGLDPADLAAALDEQVALVCLSHVNYRSSARLDLAAVTESVHGAGALMLWDLSHSAGAVPVELDAAGVDLAVGCTYKYLNAGPGAPGYLYVSEGLLGELEQPIWGWFGQADQFEMGPAYRPAPGVTRMLTGTPPVLGLLAVGAAVEMMAEVGVAALWAKSQALTGLLTQLIRERLEPAGATLVSSADPERRGAHVSVAHPQAWPWCAALIASGLVVPDFRSPDVVRLGPAPLYTRFVDVWDAVDRMAGVLAAGVGPVGAERPRVT